MTPRSQHGFPRLARGRDILLFFDRLRQESAAMAALLSQDRGELEAGKKT